MSLRDFLRILDELCPVPEVAPEPLPIHEIQVSYQLCDPEPQLGWE